MSDEKRTFLIIAAAIIIAIGVITGFLIPGNRAVTEKKADALMAADEKYIAAAAENEKLAKRVDELYATLAEVTEELNGINSYEADRNSSKKNLDSVKAQLSEVTAQVEKKQAGVKELDAKITAIGSKITLSPGMYTVGAHIPAGEYYTRGNGSILVSDAQSKLKINAKLTGSSAYTCRLSDGDVIKLETEAVFDAVG